jgi:hypothetical protein
MGQGSVDNLSGTVVSAFITRLLNVVLSEAKNPESIATPVCG